MNWKICLQCHGYGKTMSKKHKKKPPEQAVKHLNMCTQCSGSGLQESSQVTPVDTNYPHVAIIGGGIGGVALAVACQHRGIPFTLYEGDDSFDSRSQGYGLTLQQASNSMKGLGIVSLEDGITSTLHIVHDPKGKIIGEWGMRKWLQEPIKQNSKRKNIHIARQSLRASLLREIANPGSIKWGHKLDSFSHNTDETVSLSFNTKDTMARTTADLVVGADGIYSSVREQLIGCDKTPLQYLGCIVILGICPLKSLDSTTIQNSLLDSKTVFQTVNGHERIYMMPYDGDNIMWQLSFPMDEESAQKLSAQGPQSMKEEAYKRLEHWHDPITQILTATEETKITGYPVYDRAILDQELLQQSGNVTIIGDAAHPMSPFKGQGANQALLDALSLARVISSVCSRDPNWRESGTRKDILNKFEIDMLERTKSKVLDSHTAAQELHSDAVLHEGDEPRGRGIHP